MTNNQHKPNVPELRFPEFTGEWEEKKLGDLGDYLKSYPLSRAKEGLGIYKHIHYGDIHTKLPSILNDTDKLSTITEQKDFVIVEKGDVLFADASEDYADLGKATMVNFNDNNVIAGLHTHLFRPKEELISSFLINVTKTENYKRHIKKEGNGISVLGISKVNLGKFKVFLPSKIEQQKIGDFFSKLDRQIELEEKKLVLLEEQKKGYMQKIFSQELRFKDENGNDYPEWEEKKLGEVSLFQNGKAHEDIVDSNGSYKLINSKFISSEGKIIKRVKKRLSPMYVNDIAIVMSDVPNGKALAKCYFVNEKDTFTLNQRIGRIYNFLGNPYFLYLILNRNKQLLKYDSGVGQTNLKKSEIANVSLKIPEINEQNSISILLEKIDGYIITMRLKVEKLKERKEGILNQMLL
ncbi:restriction endonuclease subunit S [Staphylococcus simulans]|uniref:restriction endonuclease subunit S n=1 Tax=Staphylococcus simulans TaxID=1286 RepID=UPI000D028D2B|nr:restriction endonuclease subunit S [Staphylococcus simulans]